MDYIHCSRSEPEATKIQSTFHKLKAAQNEGQHCTEHERWKMHRGDNPAKPCKAMETVKNPGRWSDGCWGFYEEVPGKRLRGVLELLKGF